jgi:hypothetical protein
MNTKSLANMLEVNVREELASKEQALALIESQERAVAKSDVDAFVAAHEQLKKLVETDARRASKREVLLRQLADIWQVAADAQTLGSVAARLGDDGQRLAALRAELRSSVASVIKRNRRLSALLGMHRRLNRDILQVVLGAERGAEPTSAGTLVNAQA